MMERLERQRRLKNFSREALSKSKGNQNQSSSKSIGKGKKYLKNSANVVDQTKNMATACSAIDFGKDAPWLIVILFSIIADLFTLIPLFGSAFALVFSVFFWVYYAISGHYKNRAVTKAAITGLATVLEVVGVGINMLPFFTASALINYWLILAERKNKQTQE